MNKRPGKCYGQGFKLLAFGYIGHAYPGFYGVSCPAYSTVWTCCTKVHRSVFYSEIGDVEGTSLHCLPSDMESGFKRGLICGLVPAMTKPNQDQNPIMYCLSVPVHVVVVAFTVSALNLYVLPWSGYYGRRQLKLHTARDTCRNMGMKTKSSRH